MRLSGKVALVTGAARERGIGRGIALCLAEEGCDVAVNDVAAEHMAIELAPHGVTVNHVGPGWVRSAINDRSPALQTEEAVRATLKLIPAGRPADPRELGRAVVYLCSEDGDYVTGEFLRVDGGFVVGKY